jgi:large subunit ribosomal protein L19e
MRVGIDRIIFDPEAEDLIQDAITRSTIRGLVGLGAIRAAPVRGVSRGRIRGRKKRHLRGRGHGSFEGTKAARVSKKGKWIVKVRSLRDRLTVARERGDLTKEKYWVLYKQVKGGQVRNLKHLQELIREARK